MYPCSHYLASQTSFYMTFTFTHHILAMKSSFTPETGQIHPHLRAFAAAVPPSLGLADSCYSAFSSSVSFSDYPKQHDGIFGIALVTL